MISFNCSSLKLLITCCAEISVRPIDMSRLSFDLNEKPLLESFSCIDERPKSKMIVST